MAPSPFSLWIWLGNLSPRQLRALPFRHSRPQLWFPLPSVFAGTVWHSCGIPHGTFFPYQATHLFGADQEKSVCKPFTEYGLAHIVNKSIQKNLFMTFNGTYTFENELLGVYLWIVSYHACLLVLFASKLFHNEWLTSRTLSRVTYWHCTSSW